MVMEVIGSDAPIISVGIIQKGRARRLHLGYCPPPPNIFWHPIGSQKNWWGLDD